MFAVFRLAPLAPIAAWGVCPDTAPSVEITVLLRDIFIQVDVDMSGTMEWEEFTEYVISTAAISDASEGELTAPSDLQVRVATILTPVSGHICCMHCRTAVAAPDT